MRSLTAAHVLPDREKEGGGRGEGEGVRGERGRE